MLDARSDLADCSPRTQRIPSAILLFPHPFGPTIVVTPGSKLSFVFSAKDLKPVSSKDLKYMYSRYMYEALRALVRQAHHPVDHSERSRGIARSFHSPAGAESLRSRKPFNATVLTVAACVFILRLESLGFFAKEDK